MLKTKNKYLPWGMKNNIVFSLNLVDYSDPVLQFWILLSPAFHHPFKSSWIFSNPALHFCLIQYHISLGNSWRYRSEWVCERGLMLKAVTEASLCADERGKLWGSSLPIPHSPLKTAAVSLHLFVEISARHFKRARLTSPYDTHTHTLIYKQNCCRMQLIWCTKFWMRQECRQNSDFIRIWWWKMSLYVKSN